MNTSLARIETVEVNGTMPPVHYFVGFGLIPAILQIVVVIAIIWLVIKIGKLADAYSAKLKAKTS